MTSQEAVDDMMRHVVAATPAGIVLVWEDVPSDMPTTAWVRPTVKHSSRAQGSLANHGGRRMFDATGLLSVQCFTLVGDGLSSARNLSDTYVRYLEGVRNSPIWYRNIRALEIGKDGAFSQVLVLADFEYTDTH